MEDEEVDEIIVVGTRPQNDDGWWIQMAEFAWNNYLNGNFAGGGGNVGSGGGGSSTTWTTEYDETEDRMYMWSSDGGSFSVEGVTNPYGMTHTPLMDEPDTLVMFGMDALL